MQIKTFQHGEVIFCKKQWVENKPIQIPPKQRNLIMDLRKYIKKYLMELRKTYVFMLSFVFYFYGNEMFVFLFLIY